MTKAAQKMINRKKFELASFAIALDSERERKRSTLVPMPMGFTKVQDYIQKENKKARLSRDKTRSMLQALHAEGSRHKIIQSSHQGNISCES